MKRTMKTFLEFSIFAKVVFFFLQNYSILCYMNNHDFICQPLDNANKLFLYIEQ